MKSSKGFTLVELLVVIGVLGILALGLLATIDPLEQFKKGADANTRQSAIELVNALNRYYAVNSAYPWGVQPQCIGGIPNGAILNTMSICVTYLINAGELKSTFSEQTKIMASLSVTSPLGEGVTVCFNPDSKAESLAPPTKYDSLGAVKVGCPIAGGSCYWCAK